MTSQHGLQSEKRESSLRSKSKFLKEPYQSDCSHQSEHHESPPPQITAPAPHFPSNKHKRDNCKRDEAQPCGIKSLGEDQ